MIVAEQSQQSNASSIYRYRRYYTAEGGNRHWQVTVSTAK